MDNKDIRIVSTTIEQIPLKKLHLPFNPMAEPEKFYNGSPDMMSLVDSPHHELMKIFKKHGLDWSKIKHTAYWKERKRRYELGLKQWEDEHLVWHVKQRYKIFKSLKKNGYQAKKTLNIYLK